MAMLTGMKTTWTRIPVPASSVRRVLDLCREGTFWHGPTSAVPLSGISDDFVRKCSHALLATSAVGSGQVMTVVNFYRAEPKAGVYDQAPVAVLVSGGDPRPVVVQRHHLDVPDRSTPLTPAFYVSGGISVTPDPENILTLPVESTGPTSALAGTPHEAAFITMAGEILRSDD